jgi:hypothetical protein
LGEFRSGVPDGELELRKRMKGLPKKKTYRSSNFAKSCCRGLCLIAALMVLETDAPAQEHAVVGGTVVDTTGAPIQ